MEPRLNPGGRIYLNLIRAARIGQKLPVSLMEIAAAPLPRPGPPGSPGRRGGGPEKLKTQKKNFATPNLIISTAESLVLKPEPIGID